MLFDELGDPTDRFESLAAPLHGAIVNFFRNMGDNPNEIRAVGQYIGSLINSEVTIQLNRKRSSLEKKQRVISRMNHFKSVPEDSE